jgi:CubicO group peptidase (beta-lactamase class C family)
MAHTHTPGAALAVVRAGELVWSKGYGLANVAEGRPITGESLFGVASISKTAVAWGVMALVEAGQVELDAPVERYLTRWHLPPSPYDTRAVTVRRLLSHTAGLNTPEYLGYLPGQARPSIEVVLSAGDGRAPGVRMVAPAGARFAYSDGGYLLLQLLIEEVSGLPFDLAMQRAVLDPLGLPNATFSATPDAAARMVTSYDPYGAPFPLYEFVELAPAGLMISAPDLARFVAAAMPGPHGEPAGRGVLSPASIAAMQTPQVALRFPENWIYAHQYGLGLFIDRLDDGRILVSHMGGNLNGVTEFVARPQTGDAIVVLTTGINGHEVFADAVDVWTDWLGSAAATLPRAIRISRSILGALAISLALIGLALSDALVRAYHAGRRKILRRDTRPVWVRLLRIGAPPAALVVYLIWADPLLRVSMPSVATNMAIGVTALLVGVWAWAISFPAASG